MLESAGRRIDCIYIGGGTPSTLSPAMVRQLGGVLSLLPKDRVKEFTFEAGRTDTITDELLEALRDIGVGRISINPQSFTDEALRRAARSREPGEFERAFQKAKAMGFTINSDIILGLAGESAQGYIAGLRHLVSLAPDNITIHALALKRGSKNYEQNIVNIQENRVNADIAMCGQSALSRDSSSLLGDKVASDGSRTFSVKDYYLSQERFAIEKTVPVSGDAQPVSSADFSLINGGSGIFERVSQKPATYALGIEEHTNAVEQSAAIRSHREQVALIKNYQVLNREGRKLLEEAGYVPYYLYRQKKILANMENIGFSIPTKNCLYNSRIMSEKCSIFAVGTGAVSKIYYPETDTHIQFANSRSVEDYIEHFDKVLKKIETIRDEL